jgi:alanine dehydrogenase
VQITEGQVKQALSVPACIDVLREALAEDYVNIPRYRLKSASSLLHVMSASIPAYNVMGLKAYGTSRQGTGFVVLLFEERTGRVLAMVEGDALGQIRTGAASGLATDLLAPAGARIGAVVGAGYQAETQVLAIDAVRHLQEIRVYSRKPQKRHAFVTSLSGRVKAKLVAAESARACVEDADIVCTITSSRDPVLSGAWLKKGCHINAAGSNAANRRELDEEAVRRCGLVCVDSLEQSRIESGELIASLPSWDEVVELKDVVCGRAGRTDPSLITLFKSNGIAVEDVAAAHYVYRMLNKA